MTLHVTDIADSIPSSANRVENIGKAIEHRPYRDGLKRVFDIIVVSLAAIAWLPVVLVFAALAATDGRTPFYTQRRVGRDGKVFRIVKLRTMVPDADQKLAAYLEENPAAKAEWDETQKLKSDPRITKVGHILRATSMDELPQLFNVLTGDMSLVGPRPFMESQKSIYPGLGYYRVRPGITGLWQVSDRNDCSFEQRAVLDDKYERNLSFGNDLSILMKTVRAVLSCTGY